MPALNGLGCASDGAGGPRRCIACHGRAGRPGHHGIAHPFKWDTSPDALNFEDAMHAMLCYAMLAYLPISSYVPRLCMRFHVLDGVLASVARGSVADTRDARWRRRLRSRSNTTCLFDLLGLIRHYRCAPNKHRHDSHGSAAVEWGLASCCGLYAADFQVSERLGLGPATMME